MSTAIDPLTPRSPYVNGWRVGPSTTANRITHLAYRVNNKETWFGATINPATSGWHETAQAFEWEFTTVNGSVLRIFDKDVVGISDEEFERLKDRELGVYDPAYNTKLDSLTARRNELWSKAALTMPADKAVPSFKMKRAARDYAHRVIRAADGLEPHQVTLSPHGQFPVIERNAELFVDPEEEECDEDFWREIKVQLGGSKWH